MNELNYFKKIINQDLNFNIKDLDNNKEIEDYQQYINTNINMIFVDRSLKNLNILLKKNLEYRYEIKKNQCIEKFNKKFNKNCKLEGIINFMMFDSNIQKQYLFSCIFGSEDIDFKMKSERFLNNFFPKIIDRRNLCLNKCFKNKIEDYCTKIDLNCSDECLKEYRKLSEGYINELSLYLNISIQKNTLQNKKTKI